jgi:hypothetical protein
MAVTAKGKRASNPICIGDDDKEETSTSPSTAVPSKNRNLLMISMGENIQFLLGMIVLFPSLLISTLTSTEVVQ